MWARVAERGNEPVPLSRTRWLSLVLLAILLGGAVYLGYALYLQGQRENALKAAREGDFAEAEPRLKACLARVPTDAEVLRALARGYLSQGRKGEAEECLNAWLDQAPTETEALQLRLARDLARYDAALGDLEQLISRDPDNPSLRRRRPGLLFSAGRFAEADHACQECLTWQPADRALLGLLAEIKRAQRDFAAAGEILDRVLRDAPQDVATLMAKAMLLYDTDQPAEAVPLYRQVLRLDPSRQRTARYHLSLALARIDPNDPEAHRLIEEVRHMQDAELLLADSNKQLDNIPLQIRSARAQFENNDLRRALKILEHVLQLDARSTAAHALLAEIFEKEGRPDLAAEQRRLAKPNP
jgi:tetratricopeptide (TPR) repeat protein